MNLHIKTNEIEIEQKRTAESAKYFSKCLDTDKTSDFHDLETLAGQMKHTVRTIYRAAEGAQIDSPNDDLKAIGETAWYAYMLAEALQARIENDVPVGTVGK